MVLALMALQLLRALQESRSARAGFITFGGDDRYQARNVRRVVHDSVMIARVHLEMPTDGFEAVIGRIRQNLPGQAMKKCAFTMGNTWYPVFAMAFIFEDPVHTSFMVHKPAFDAQAFMAEGGAVPLDLMLRRCTEG